MHQLIYIIGSIVKLSCTSRRLTNFHLLATRERGWGEDHLKVENVVVHLNFENMCIVFLILEYLMTYYF